ncbi:SWIM zinc finger family protein [Streptomyces sp. NPDC088350]|uniref:SWIM zinc finger family protein n=1 Tax=Streptomyces sp. NPDC088350 TaxID=3365854 RepID=UPI0038069670
MRPADLARQALRAARERRERVPEKRAERPVDPGELVARAPMPSDPEEIGETEVKAPPPAGPSPSVPRPGDAARAALRGALPVRREAATVAGPSEEVPGDSATSASARTSRDSATGVPANAVDTHADLPALAAGDDAPDQSATRPADAAREALRTARREVQRVRTDTGPASSRSPRPRPSFASRPRAQEPNGVEAVRARAIRDLVADAFRMPQDEDSDAVPPGANDHAGQASRDVRTPDRTDPEEQPTAPPTTLTPTTTPPRPPTSMASPSRDSDLRRTFPAFPPLPSHAGTGFAETWWGNAWVTALEEGALDAKRLARGRSYAEKGHVDAITVTPGLVLAYVQGSRPRPYRVQVRLRTLDEADWERFLDAAADRPGHIAALLDKEMPKSLAESGVPLLPGPGDLDPLCSCPDSGHPCKHAAALCYQTARLLDADPFVLLLLRGRGERPLLDALSRRNAARAARAAQEQEPAPLPGVRATDALAPRRLPPLPPPLPTPPHPEQPPVYPAAPGGPDPFALDQLATDAAARAHALLSTGRDPVGDLTLWQDAVRLAAARPGSGLTATTRSLYASLAKATGRGPGELARAVAAWRQGGIEGLAVLEEPWDPPAGRFDRARPLLLAADLPAFRPWHNHLTHPHGHVQLRLGRDGLWYAYESEPGHEDWWPRGTPDLDPVGALTGLGAPGEL